jgi:hypothetical protein
MYLQIFQIVRNIFQATWYFTGEVVETQITARGNILLIELQ